ncbi:MAG: hypothetical protein A2X79_01780 [Desulfuromonadaceae bacterium GWB2_53_15]|nr:MAG: hypothetical protein A2X83_02070 [Desulfuromonadales bacterium GWD2_54_10]OHB32670.1 MAG: hypothetical protein A2X79_01780 [Desulfuromonadaceae bacterium GWB2_53_15]
MESAALVLKMVHWIPPYGSVCIQDKEKKVGIYITGGEISQNYISKLEAVFCAWRAENNVVNALIHLFHGGGTWGVKPPRFKNLGDVYQNVFMRWMKASSSP